MSDYLSAQVWFSDLTPTLKPLAATLANIAGDDGENIYPSVEYLVWRIGSAESTVRLGMKRLREMGILVVVAGGVGGRGRPTEYRMEAEALPKRPRWKNKPSDNRTLFNAKPSDLLAKPSDLGILNPPINSNERNSILIEEKQTIKTPREEEGIVPISLWLAFVEMRKKIKAPMTEHAQELIRRQLEKLRGDGFDPVEVLEQSIRNCWRDVFPIRKGSDGNSKTKTDVRGQRTASALNRVLGPTEEMARDVRPALPAGD